MAELLRPGPGEDQGGEDHLAFLAVPTRIPVEFRPGVQERLDLGGRVEVDRPARRLLKAALATAGGVLGDVAVVEGDPEKPRQGVDRLVDRPRGERPQDLAVVVAARAPSLDRP